MSLEIVQLGQPVLRRAAEPVTAEELASDAFQGLIDDMVATMNEAKGVGLAGPQVFLGKRLFVAAILPGGDKPRPEVFINPRLSGFSDEKPAAWEGCLSFLELMVLVPRHKSLRVDYLTRAGEPKALELSGFPARVVQHEYDHLDGVLTIDRAESTKHIVKTSELDAAQEAFGGEEDGDDDE